MIRKFAAILTSITLFASCSSDEQTTELVHKHDSNMALERVKKSDEECSLETDFYVNLRQKWSKIRLNNADNDWDIEDFYGYIRKNNFLGDCIPIPIKMIVYNPRGEVVREVKGSDPHLLKLVVGREEFEVLIYDNETAGRFLRE